MERIEKVIVAVVLVILLFLTAILIFQSVSPDESENIHSVSVLVNDLNEYTRLGMDKAALEYNLDVHYISDFGQDPVQQITLIQREINNGVDAIVLAPVDAAYIATKLDELHISLPIITLCDPLVTAADTIHVAPDDTALGRMLAERILTDEPVLPYTVLMEYESPMHIQARYTGLTSAFTAAGKQAECCFVENDAAAILAQLVVRPDNVFVTLDESLLPAICEGGLPDGRLYAIGYTGVIRPYLENGSIVATAIYSTFDEGYLSMRAAEASIRAPGQPDMVLAGMLADSSNMYELPEELILFPISK